MNDETLKLAIFLAFTAFIAYNDLSFWWIVLAVLVT